MLCSVVRCTSPHMWTPWVKHLSNSVWNLQYVSNHRQTAASSSLLSDFKFKNTVLDGFSLCVSARLCKAAEQRLSEFCNFCPLGMLRTHSALPDPQISLGTVEYLVFHYSIKKKLCMSIKLLSGASYSRSYSAYLAGRIS